jgi:hypothetical protein
LAGAVTALRFSRDGALLASGSADTTLVVWDVVAEAGLCRFKGHKDAITDLVSSTDHCACVGWQRVVFTLLLVKEYQTQVEQCSTWLSNHRKRGCHQVYDDVIIPQSQQGGIHHPL